MGSRAKFRALYMAHPSVFERMREWRASGMTMREIADRVRNEYGMDIPITSLSQYLWRYSRLQESTGNFWTPERIRRFRAEFSRSLHAYVYARAAARIDETFARRLVETVLSEMCERVVAQERGEQLAPISNRLGGYRGHPPVEQTVLGELRLQRDLTLETLARRARVQNYTLTKWERYGVVPNSLEIIARVADALGVPIERLLEDYHRYKRIDRRDGRIDLQSSANGGV